MDEQTEIRRFTAEQKLEILEEADQPGVTVSEVCPRHALAVSVFYRWRAVAQGGSAVALKRDAQRTPRKDDPEVRHKAQMERLRAVIAEITAHLLKMAGVTRTTGNTGAVVLIQRFSSALNLNVHFHMVFLAGVYLPSGDQLFGH